MVHRSRDQQAFVGVHGHDTGQVLVDAEELPSVGQQNSFQTSGRSRGVHLDRHLIGIHRCDRFGIAVEQGAPLRRAEFDSRDAAGHAVAIGRVVDNQSNPGISRDPGEGGRRLPGVQGHCYQPTTGDAEVARSMVDRVLREDADAVATTEAPRTKSAGHSGTPVVELAVADLDRRRDVAVCHVEKCQVVVAHPPAEDSTEISFVSSISRPITHGAITTLPKNCLSSTRRMASTPSLSGRTLSITGTSFPSRTMSRRDCRSLRLHPFEPRISISAVQM